MDEERRRLQVNMWELHDGMTASGNESHYFDLQTGNVIIVPEMEEDQYESVLEQAHRFLPVPRFTSRMEFRLMKQFAAGVDDQVASARLDLALDGRGAFRRFRNVLYQYPALRDSWYKRREEALTDEAVAWLRAMGVEPVYEERTQQRSHAARRQQAVAAKQEDKPRLSLVHVLLFGGKPELLGGRAYRFIYTNNPDEARRLFKSLARELCQWHGEAWHNRFIEARTSFVRGDIEIGLEGTTIVVKVTVPEEIYLAFRE